MTDRILTGRLAVWGLMALLGACSANVQEPFRQQDAPLGATTRFDASSFSGSWQTVAQFSNDQEKTTVIEVTSEDDLLQFSGSVSPDLTGFYRQGIPGELIPLDADREKLIVMWVAEDFETAAIGTPSGSLGLLLDRDGSVPADRFQAAQDVLQFYGWDVSRLKRTGS